MNKLVGFGSNWARKVDRPLGRFIWASRATDRTSAIDTRGYIRRDFCLNFSERKFLTDMANSGRDISML